MLQLTEEAVGVIHAATAEADVPESAGMRIAPVSAQDDSVRPPLGLSLAVEPAADDQVIEAEGARVFLAAEVAPLLASQTLDVQVEAGEPNFYLR